MIELLFNGKDHENAFYTLLKELSIRPDDNERMALVYVLTITKNCRENFYDCYDPKIGWGVVKSDALENAWVTSSDARAIRLAFNLFNGRVPTALNPSSESEYNLYDSKRKFVYNQIELFESTPVNVFCDSCIGKYLVEGLKMRYPGMF